jgi:hypothetical protein
MKNGLSMLFIGFVAGAATVAALPVLTPMLTDIARPVSKAVIKHGLLGLERLRTSVALISESLDDLMAEIRAEVEVELAKSRGASAADSTNGSGAQASQPSMQGPDASASSLS